MTGRRRPHKLRFEDFEVDLYSMEGRRYGTLTGTIIGCAFEVANELGAGFLESVYERAMLIALREKGLEARGQVGVQVMFRGQPVGLYYADILVAGKVIIELKAVQALAPIHSAQVINYLHATGIEVGLLINFGTPEIQYRRLSRERNGEF